ncbi:MAG: hypothetical protein NVS3B2_04670 [Ramlibacter sp.]
MPDDSAPLDDHLSEHQAAELLHVSVRTLQRWRGQRFGPRWIKIGQLRVRYARADLDAWIESRTVAGQPTEETPQ